MIEAIKQAYEVPLVEQLESVPNDARLVIDDADGMGTRFIPVGRMCHDAAKTLRTAIEAAEKQEPVAWSRASFIEDDDGRQIGTDEPEILWGKEPPDEFGWSPLYTTPQPQRELNCVCGAVWEGDEMVCVPRKREWVGLTDEEKQKFLGGDAYGATVHDINAIEAKLKEKNT